jgi:mono/diheme cytochrome c family protein
VVDFINGALIVCRETHPSQMNSMAEGSSVADRESAKGAGRVNLISVGMAILAFTGTVLLASRPVTTADYSAAFKAAALQAKDEGAPLSPDAARKLKSPIPFTRKSISRGRTIFMGSCTACHGTDGKALVDVVADATDLTSPKLWRNGTTEGEIFKSIRDGAGTGMPPFKFQIHQQEDLWHLVNYIRSLWPESLRPQLEEDPPQGKTK